jgi:hypothetical protein
LSSAATDAVEPVIAGALWAWIAGLKIVIATRTSTNAVTMGRKDAVPV